MAWFERHGAASEVHFCVHSSHTQSKGSVYAAEVCCPSVQYCSDIFQHADMKDRCVFTKY